MEIICNPVLISVLVLCALCLFKLNVLASLLIAAIVGALAGGIPIVEGIEILTGGFALNATTALSYVLLGTFATAIATTGLADVMSKKLTYVMSSGPKTTLLVLAGVACLSQNLIPVHIAFIPILIPPLLSLMNRLKIDRRATACSLAFGLKAPYIAVPFGFGTIFMGLIAQYMTSNGMPVTPGDVAKYNWTIAAAMFIGLLTAIFITYAKPREYRSAKIDTSAADAVADKLTYEHYVTIAAIVAVIGVQLWTDSLLLASIAGIALMIVFRGIKWNAIDAQFEGGIKIMGMIPMIMLVAGGFSEVMKATGGVESLVEAAASMMHGSRVIAAIVIVLIGLLVTMGIGSSFSTIPITAVIYVPLCAEIGFSPAATIVLLSAAAALGDAGSPASDTTLGPTSGLNADGCHDHIRDTCIPTFLHFNIPIAIAAVVVSQFI